MIGPLISTANLWRGGNFNWLVGIDWVVNDVSRGEAGSAELELAKGWLSWEELKAADNG